MLIGYFTAGTHVPNVTSWLVMGTAFGALLCAAWVWVLRHHLALVIPMVTATVVLDNIGNLTSPMYSGALPGYLLGSLLADRKSTRLNSSHVAISYAVFCLKKTEFIKIAIAIHVRVDLYE